MNFLMGGASYEAPAISVLEIENEGAVCSASTQAFEEDYTTLFTW